MDSIPFGDSDFFFVPRWRHVVYPIFSYFFSGLKIHHLSLFITYRALRHCCMQQHSSMQEAYVCHHELSKYDLCYPQVLQYLWVRPASGRSCQWSIPVGDSDFLSYHAQDMLNSPSFLKDCLSSRLESTKAVVFTTNTTRTGTKLYNQPLPQYSNMTNNKYKVTWLHAKNP